MPIDQANAAPLTDQEKINAETCPVHLTPMIKHQEHIGDGQTRWTEPYCPRCEELKGAGKYDEAMASIEADKRSKAPGDRAALDRKTAELSNAAPVKPDAAPAKSL